jgi:hypothetical protein
MLWILACTAVVPSEDSAAHGNAERSEQNDCNPPTEDSANGGAAEDGEGDGGETDGSSGDGGSGDGGPGGDTTTGTIPACEPGVICIDSFPYHYEGDTSSLPAGTLDAYGCSPDTDEGGSEVIFRLDTAKAGFVSALVTDDPEADVDIDVHLLASLDPDDCIDRGNLDVTSHVDAGSLYIVADTYVSGGTPQAGEFALDIGYVIPEPGSCAMETGWLDRVGTSVDLAMPATGPVVMEAHLVTVEDGFGTSASGDWPNSYTEGLDGHYERAGETSGMFFDRSQVWCPQESSEYGQAAYGSKLPIEDETWYVNMYWSDRPDAGTRMILQKSDGTAVVVAAGYETGPGDLDNVGGVGEEVHTYLGTGHESVLTLGFAVDQTLPLGPIACW